MKNDGKITVYNKIVNHKLQLTKTKTIENNNNKNVCYLTFE